MTCILPTSTHYIYTHITPRQENMFAIKAQIIVNSKRAAIRFLIEIYHLPWNWGIQQLKLVLPFLGLRCYNQEHYLVTQLILVISQCSIVALPLVLITMSFLLVMYLCKTTILSLIKVSSNLIKWSKLVSLQELKQIKRAHSIIILPLIHMHPNQRRMIALISWQDLTINTRRRDNLIWKKNKGRQGKRCRDNKQMLKKLWKMKRKDRRDYKEMQINWPIRRWKMPNKLK